MIGDTPYGDAQLAQFPAMVDDINDDPAVRMVLHAGDIKNGSSTCSNERFLALRDLFDTFEDPLVLTPGDNEWTDCHRAAAGRYLPTERLDQLRHIFYPQPGHVLGRHPMRVLTQADDPVHADYVENQLWMRSGVTFATVHVVGSNNDLEPWSGLPGGDVPTERRAEYETRLAAALDWLDETFQVAAERGARGVFVMIHADPHFELPEGHPERAGFEAFLQGLEMHTTNFGGPVVLAHGDSHVYRLDQPWPEVPNLTRVETFGAEASQWIRVTIDPRGDELFTFQTEEV